MHERRSAPPGSGQWREWFNSIRIRKYFFSRGDRMFPFGIYQRNLREFFDGIPAIPGVLKLENERIFV